MLPLLVVYLHGASGAWDEIVMLAGSVLIGLALAFVLRPKKPEQTVPTEEQDESPARRDVVEPLPEMRDLRVAPEHPCFVARLNGPLPGS